MKHPENLRITKENLQKENHRKIYVKKAEENVIEQIIDEELTLQETRDNWTS